MSKEQSPWSSSTVTPERSVSVCGRGTTWPIAAWRPMAARAIGRQTLALGDSIRPFQCEAFHGFVAAQKNVAIVAFRGTESIGNALTDAETALIRHDIFPGLVHLGFAHAAEAVYPTVRDLLTALDRRPADLGHGPQPRRGHGHAGRPPLVGRRFSGPRRLHLRFAAARRPQFPRRLSLAQLPLRERQRPGAAPALALVLSSCRGS